MTQRRFSGFVLSSLPLSDHSHLLNLYTAESGKRKAILHTHRKVSRAYLTLLARLGFILTGREHQELPTMSEVSLESHRFDWASSYTGMALFQHWAYLVDTSHVAGQEDERVYRLLDHMLTSLGPDPRDKVDLPARNLYFEAWLLHLSGMLPRPSGGLDESLPPASSAKLDQEQSFNPAHFDTRLHGDEPVRLLARLPKPILRQLFRNKVEAYLAALPELESPALAIETLGRMWELFLGRPLPSRSALFQLLDTHATGQEKRKNKDLF